MVRWLVNNYSESNNYTGHFSGLYLIYVKFRKNKGHSLSNRPLTFIYFVKYI